MLRHITFSPKILSLHLQKNFEKTAEKPLQMGLNLRKFRENCQLSRFVVVVVVLSKKNP